MSKCKVFSIDAFNGIAATIQEFDRVSDYQFKEWIVGNNAELKATRSKNQLAAIGFLMHYSDVCYKHESAETIEHMQSAFEADSQRLFDFLSSSPDDGWFVFFTIEGTDMNLMFVPDLQSAKTEFGFK